MSLYNMVHGINPATGILLMMLDLDEKDVPRLRDTWVTEDGEIAIHTRTGGGNREGYAEENGSLQRHPNYLRDFDDDFDCTYATFVFSCPESSKDMLTLLRDEDRMKAPRDRWVQAIDDLKAGKRGDILEKMTPTMDAILRAVDTNDDLGGAE